MKMFWFTFGFLHIVLSSTVNYSWVYTTNSSNGEITYTHMSMIEVIINQETNNLPLIVTAWQASKYDEGYNDQHIMFSYSTDYGVTFSTPVTIANDPNYAVWGPVLKYDSMKQILWFFYSVSTVETQRSTNQSYPGGNIFYKISSNNGKNWSEPGLIVNFTSLGNIAKVTANKPIFINNRLILPFFAESQHPKKCHGAVAITDDYGENWSFSKYVYDSNDYLEENTLSIIPNTNNTILQFYRTNIGYIYESLSYDLGNTWTASNQTVLLNPNAKTFMFNTVDNKSIILAYNPSSTKRNPLILSSSFDGKSWNQFVELDSYNASDMHYPQYPTSVQIKVNGQNFIYTTYSDDTYVGIKLAITQMTNTIL